MQTNRAGIDGPNTQAQPHRTRAGLCHRLQLPTGNGTPIAASHTRQTMLSFHGSFAGTMKVSYRTRAGLCLENHNQTDRKGPANRQEGRSKAIVNTRESRPDASVLKRTHARAKTARTGQKRGFEGGTFSHVTRRGTHPHFCTTHFFDSGHIEYALGSPFPGKEGVWAYMRTGVPSFACISVFIPPAPNFSAEKQRLWQILRPIVNTGYPSPVKPSSVILRA